MSNFYQYQDAKITIVRGLSERGWKIHGFHEDNSDAMIDYYDPEYWSGIAEKDGYILCVHVSSTGGQTENMPGYMANPSRCNWHLEKDGKYILKGNGILKFAGIASYCRYPHYTEKIKQYRENPEKWEKDLAEEYTLKGIYNTPERCTEAAKREAENMAKDSATIDKFNEWLDKLGNPVAVVENPKSGTSYNFDIKADTDTRDGSELWVVRCIDKLEKAAYIELNRYIRTLGGYYSKFKHGFIFRENPAEILLAKEA